MQSIIADMKRVELSSIRAKCSDMTIYENKIWKIVGTEGAGINYRVTLERNNERIVPPYGVKLYAIYTIRSLEKPAITDIKALVEIYYSERLSWIENAKMNQYYGEYWWYVMLNHLEAIKNFETIDQLDTDLRNNVRMSFDEWYDTL